MKNPFILLGALALALVSWTAGPSGQELGDNATIIVPAGAITNLRQVLVVKTAPKATATKVGNCASGALHFQDAQLVDRASPSRGSSGEPGPSVATTVVPTQVTVVIPGASGFKELKPGWHLGSWRSGGKCGPGYDIYLAHIIAIE